MKPPTMEQLRKIRAHVVEVGRHFDRPDDDWQMMAFLFNRRGGVAVCPVVVGRDGKDAVVPALALVAKEHGAAAGAFVVSCWHVELVVEEGPLADLALDMLGRFGVESRPDRKECVQVELYDGKATELWSAEILRDEVRPPTLGEWRLMPEDNTGRLANVLERAIKGGA